MRFIILGLLLISVPVIAQERPDADRAAILNQLFSALLRAPSEEDAATLEQRIRQAWLEGGSPAVTLLMMRGLREMQTGSQEEALADFDAAATLDPDLAVAYDRRAMARFQQGDIAGAIHDIEETLRHEPRDFSALQDLSRIAESQKNWAGAYAAWLKVIEIDPKTPGGADRLKDLKRRALGDAT
jgi:tetratricopeptide (TPR) repeat protein